MPTVRLTHIQIPQVFYSTRQSGWCRICGLQLQGRVVWQRVFSSMVTQCQMLSLPKLRKVASLLISNWVLGNFGSMIMQQGSFSDSDSPNENGYVWDLKSSIQWNENFNNFRISHIPRERNGPANNMANGGTSVTHLFLI